jgi:hypothetical protein
MLADEDSGMGVKSILEVAVFDGLHFICGHLRHLRFDVWIFKLPVCDAC